MTVVSPGGNVGLVGPHRSLYLSPWPHFARIGGLLCTCGWKEEKERVRRRNFESVALNHQESSESHVPGNAHTQNILPTI